MNQFQIIALVIQLYRQLLVMSPSRAEEFSAQLGSARDLFHLARKQKLAKNERKSAENEPKFQDLSLINFHNKLD